MTDWTITCWAVTPFSAWWLSACFGALSEAIMRASGIFCAACGPTLDYARALRANAAPRYLGHNPLGGWMIAGLLATLALQGFTGLFASDDAMTNGPLTHMVSEQISRHSDGNSRRQLQRPADAGSCCMSLRSWHTGVFKGENLVRAMLTGYKDPDEASKKQ